MYNLLSISYFHIKSPLWIIMWLWVLSFEFTFSGGISIASFGLVMWSFCPSRLVWCLQLNWINTHFEVISMVEGQDESIRSQGIH